jgi:two-component system response regulator NreC
MRSLLAASGPFEIVGVARDAREAYLQAEQTRPDVIVLDVTLPGVDGICATRELRRRVPKARVLILSMHTMERVVKEALSAGAAGYALKSQELEGVIEGIVRVAAGGRYLAPEIPARLLSECEGEGGGPLGGLSSREREVFDLVVRGFSNRAISAELCISVKTVETHRAHIHQKIGVHSVAGLMRFAVVNGLVNDPPTPSAPEGAS